MSFRANLSVSSTQHTVELDAVVIAGYTGRDRQAVMEHIEELAVLGVPAPESIPAYWLLPPFLVSTEQSITVAGPGTSGEAELCLVVDGDDVFVTLASDHTDREAETIDIELSKAICPKPIATQAWPITEIDGRWDDLVLRSWIEDDGVEVLYQDGRCSALVPAPDLLAGIPFERPARFALLTGTVPVIGGIRPSAHFRAELHDPIGRRTIGLDYHVRTLRAAPADQTTGRN